MGDSETKINNDIADSGNLNNNRYLKNIKIEEPSQSNSEPVENIIQFANTDEFRRTSKMDEKRGSKFSRRSSKPRKSSAVPPKVIDLDDVLINELGQFGKYQLFSLLLVSIPIIMAPFSGEYVFTVAAIPHRCRISECGETTKDHPMKPSWLPAAIPHTDNGFSSCERYVPVTSGPNGTLDVCSAELFTDATTSCDGYVYERNNSLVFDFDLGCQEWLRTLAGTMNSVGTLLVLPFIGFISDRYGRRVALIISVFNFALIGLIRAFSVNYAMYVTLQLLQTTLGSGTFSAAYIFVAELVGPKYRVFTSATCSSMFALGQVILGGVAWFGLPWRYYIMVLHIPCFIIIVYYWILNESVRWLLSKKMFVEARAILEKVAKVNNKQISEKSMEGLMNPPEQIPEELKNVEGPSLITYVYRSPVLLRRVCTTPIWWITSTLVYYGLTINSVGFSDTIYLNFMLVSAIEIPGFYTAVLVLNWIGRKATISIGFFLSAACNVAFILIPNDMTGLRLAMFLVGKFSISVVLTSIYLYTSELYPTQYRHSLLAFSSMIGRIGSIVAPLTPVLAEYWEGIPSTMFAAMALLSGVLVLTQPETLGTRMPDTLAEAEVIGRPESKVNKDIS